jgi:hypothetical protein
VHNPIIIQPSDLMRNYFLQFTLLFKITQQVVHTQSTPFQVSWVRSILKHKPEENRNCIEINTEIIHLGSLQWQKSSLKQYETGRQPCTIQDGTATNFTIFIQNVIKFVHVIIKQCPLPPLYVMHLEKIHILHSTKYGA